MASTFSLQGKLGLDAKDFVSGAKKAEDAIGDVADELDTLPDSAKKSGGDAGQSLGSSLKGSFAALGVGAAVAGVFAVAFSREMDRQNVTKTLTTQFGKTAEEADRYGKIAGDLYADNWGDSMADVAEAIGAVDQRLVQTGQIGVESLEGVTEKALALADAFDTDVSAVVRSVSQLMLNGLAPDADTAMDLVTTALQNGSNAAGDLFDSIDEYSQHFSAFGLSAEDMMAMFSDGMANGQRDTDKMADAVKEMFIRTTDGSASTRAAFDRIGLSTETMAGKITAGGDSAREAFIDILSRINVIEDPIDRTTTGVALMGTMFEDLGPKGVDSLLAIQNGLGDVEGATQGVVDGFATTEGGLESLKRRATGALAGIGEAAGDALNSLMGAEPVWERLAGAADILKEKGPASFDAAIEAVKPYVTSMAEAELAVRMYQESVDDATAALVDQHQPQVAIVQGYIDEALEAAAAARETDALAEEVNALGGEAGDTATALDEMTAEFDAMKASMSDRSAFLSVMDGFEGIEAQGMEAFNAAATGAEDAEEKLRDYEQAQIDLKNEVIDYATEVGNIPAETVTEINSLIDQGEFAKAEARIAELERERETTLTVKIRPVGTTFSVNYTPRMVDGGGPVASGEMAWVAEKRPELVNGMLIHTPTLITGPADVTGGAETAALFARSAAAMASASTPRPTQTDAPNTIANGYPAVPQLDPTLWGRQAANAYSRQLQMNQRAS